MTNDSAADDLRLLLLRMTADGVQSPDRRARIVRRLRAAIALLEDESEAAGHPLATPGAAKALEELTFSLGMAHEHAALLAERAAMVSARSPPRP